MGVKSINLVFMGNFLYPKGMAATKRIQHLVDVFSGVEDVNVSLLLLRQSHVGRDSTNLSGMCGNVPYVTIGHDIALDWRLPFSLARYLAAGLRYLWRTRSRTVRNVLYVYGEANVENVIFIMFSRLLGFRIVFDIVEDHYYVGQDAHYLSRLKSWTSSWLMRHLSWFADGVIVISGYLLDKYKSGNNNTLPVHLHPVSVDFAYYPGAKRTFGDPVRVLYAGSFSDKDTVGDLVAAFENVCKRHGNIELVLTGQGTRASMDKIEGRIKSSPNSSRIHYLGFLDNDEYYDVINNCDIHCMIRNASSYANAGFPFKLGEYLATGNPTIASRTGDVSKYLVDRRSAMLVTPGSVDDISCALEYLLDHPERAGEIGQEGRKVAMENFEKHYLGDNLLKFLGRI